MSLSKVFFLSPEIEPFSSTYSVSNFSTLFGSEIKKNKEVDIRMCQPKYGYISERKYILREVIRLKDLEIEFCPENRISNLKSAFIPLSRVQVYFMEEEEFFRPISELLYKSRNGRVYTDNDIKFAFFSKTILHSLKKLFWAPEVVVCNDWQMSFVPILGKQIYRSDEFYKDIKYVYIIHSHDSNRNYSKEAFDSLGLSSSGFKSKDNNINAIENSDYTIILNDINNPIMKKIQKSEVYKKVLNKNKHKVIDVDYSSSDCNSQINEVIKKIRSL